MSQTIVAEDGIITLGFFTVINTLSISFCPYSKYCILILKINNINCEFFSKGSRRNEAGGGGFSLKIRESLELCSKKQKRSRSLITSELLRFFDYFFNACLEILVV